jgi:hypothetical protein
MYMLLECTARNGEEVDGKSHAPAGPEIMNVIGY